MNRCGPSVYSRVTPGGDYQVFIDEIKYPHLDVVLGMAHTGVWVIDQLRRN